MHIDHSKLDKSAQTMSIVTSCRYLGVDTFVPPFNKYNDDTVVVCMENGIRLVTRSHWKGLEYNDFTPDHKKWYFHPWRYTDESFEEAICYTG